MDSFVEDELVVLSATFALFAGTGQCAKLLIPFTFERVGDEAVTRIDQHEAVAERARLLSMPPEISPKVPK
uniref:Transposase n=1 Tax=Rhizobium meliloti TaxID=382 RepID=I2E1N2_RHIML|nr:transposase [Sinorhizobium meliloti]